MIESGECAECGEETILMAGIAYQCARCMEIESLKLDESDLADEINDLRGQLDDLNKQIEKATKRAAAVVVRLEQLTEE